MKTKKYKILLLIALSLILGLFNDISIATIIEYPLACAGTYNPGNTGWETDFDLGVEFTEIDSVSIQWSGEFTGGRSVYYNAPNDPFPIYVGILADFGRNPTFRSTKVKGGEQTYPNPEPFDTTSFVELHFDETWSDLLDGKGNVKIYYTEPFLYEGYVIESGSVFLNDAKILIDGTLVPEPMSIVFLALGVVILRRKEKIRKH